MLNTYLAVNNIGMTSILLGNLIIF